MSSMFEPHCPECGAEKFRGRCSCGYIAEHWELECNGSWTTTTWYFARSWSGRVRLNGQPWYGPSALLGHGLPNPYYHN